MVSPLLLIAILAVPVSAEKLPDCIHVSSTSVRYKADLDAVRDCQEKARKQMDPELMNAIRRPGATIRINPRPIEDLFTGIHPEQQRQRQNPPTTFPEPYLGS